MRSAPPVQTLCRSQVVRSSRTTPLDWLSWLRKRGCRPSASGATWRGVAASSPMEVDRAALQRRVADFVARLLRGAPASEMPIEAPTTFELAVNLRTAKTLGIDVPTTLLSQADEIIE
jgi:hypothetical protein